MRLTVVDWLCNKVLKNSCRKKKNFLVPFPNIIQPILTKLIRVIGPTEIWENHEKLKSHDLFNRSMEKVFQKIQKLGI